MGKIAFFFRLFYWFSLRHLLRHRFRAMAVLAGIALGAAVFSSVRLSVHASLDAFRHSMSLIAGRAQWVVAKPGGRMDESILPKILMHPAVRSASPLLTAYVTTPDPLAEPFLLIGLDPILDRPFRTWQMGEQEGDDPLLWLELIGEPFTLVAGKPLQLKNGWSPGDEVAIEHVGRKRSFRILSALDASGLALVEGGFVAVTDIATFQELTGLSGKVDRVDIAFHREPGPGDLEEIRGLLPPGVFLHPTTEKRDSGQGMIQAYQLNLSVLSFVSLFVGMFLVYSLVALNAASRRHELAVLLSTGASPGLLFSVFLSEGALFGILGWLAAMPLGTILVKYLLNEIGRTITTLFVRVQVEQARLSGWEILLSFGVTVFVCLLAALQPAREAMKVPPREAMATFRDAGSSRRMTGKLAALGLCLVLPVWPLANLPAPPGFPLPGYVATFLLFAGFSLLSPWFLQRMGTVLPPLLRRLAGEPAYLAGRYLRDSGMRVAISVGSLITAVALFSALVIMVNSFRGTVEIWVNQTLTGDIFTAAKMAELNAYRDVIPPETIEALKSLETAADRVAYRRFYLHYGSVPYQLEAIDLETFLRYGEFFWIRGSTEAIRHRLLSGQGVVVSEVFANRTGLFVGDTFRAYVEDVRLEAEILGIIRDYRTRGGVVFFPLDRFQALSAASGTEGEGDRWTGVRFFVRHREGDLDAAISHLKEKIIRCCGDSLDMVSGRELRQEVLRVFDETFAITTVLLVIALVVATLGIATTLTVLVLERSRQLNTILAVGGSRRQLRAMIFWEAFLMVAAGEAGGLLCGWILSCLLVFVINKQSFGWTFVYRIDAGALAMSLPLILLTALVAALPAVRLVFRLPPAEVLKFEG